MKRNGTTCETRYRHKLSMLEPGFRMFCLTGALCLLGAILWLAELRRAACAALGWGAMFFLILLIRVAVELHPNRVLNDPVLREERERQVRA